MRNSPPAAGSQRLAYPRRGSGKTRTVRITAAVRAVLGCTSSVIRSTPPGYRRAVALDPVDAPSLDSLRALAAGCTHCDLYERATQTVFGEGPEDARLVMVGEQPGDHEDREGHPFVGPAGRLLDDALR